MKSHKVFFFLVSALIFAGCNDKATQTTADVQSVEAESSEAANPIQKGSVLLQTEIPSEVIEGTPQPIKVPNLVPAPKNAPTLSVPEGTALISHQKPVQSSDDFPIIGELSYITDGDKQAGEGYFVELMDGLQWVQIDLEASFELYAIWIWHYHSQARAYHDVIVQVSNDPDFASEVSTLFNNDYDGSSGIAKGTHKPYVETRFGKLIDAQGIQARYVRLYSNGNTANDMNHYTEVEVYGVTQEP